MKDIYGPWETHDGEHGWRDAMLEFATRFNQPIELVMAAALENRMQELMTDKPYRIKKVY